MGCGPGPLNASEHFKITLVFKPDIAETHAVYTNFQSAVIGFLRERFDDWQPHHVAEKVRTVDVLLHGPINTVEAQKQFNRAMNRLLWGVRIVCPGDDVNEKPLPSGYRVKVQALQKEGQAPTGPDWTHEDTCGLS